MSDYTLDLNGKRYKLSDSFKESIEQLAQRQYGDNKRFDCWWKIDDGNPVLVIETVGCHVPWDRVDKLEMEMPEEDHDPSSIEDIDSGNGMAEMEPDDVDREVDFGRTHFIVTPHRFEEKPTPVGDEPDKLPQAPERISEDPEMMIWIPRHPDIEETWAATETLVPIESWIEWDVQSKADQPRPSSDNRRDKPNSHDMMESMCLTYDCEVIAEAKPSNDITEEVSGSVERKGAEAYEDGKYGGSHWNV